MAIEGAACSASRNGCFTAVASNRTEEWVGPSNQSDDSEHKISPDSLVFKAAIYLL